MNTLSRSRLLYKTLEELRKLKDQGPTTSYRAALQVAAPGLLEELLEHHDSLELDPSEQMSQVIADWLWIRILGWCQRHNVPEMQREELFRLVESVHSGLPLTAPPSTDSCPSHRSENLDSPGSRQN